MWTNRICARCSRTKEPPTAVVSTSVTSSSLRCASSLLGDRGLDVHERRQDIEQDGAFVSSNEKCPPHM